MFGRPALALAGALRRAGPVGLESSALSASMYASIEAAMMFVLRALPLYSPPARAPSAPTGGWIATMTSPSASEFSASAWTS